MKNYDDIINSLMYLLKKKNVVDKFNENFYKYFLQLNLSKILSGSYDYLTMEDGVLIDTLKDKYYLKIGYDNILIYQNDMTNLLIKFIFQNNKFTNLIYEENNLVKKYSTNMDYYKYEELVDDSLIYSRGYSFISIIHHNAGYFLEYDFMKNKSGILPVKIPLDNDYIDTIFNDLISKKKKSLVRFKHFK